MNLDEIDRTKREELLNEFAEVLTNKGISLNENGTLSKFSWQNLDSRLDYNRKAMKTHSEIINIESNSYLEKIISYVNEIENIEELKKYYDNINKNKSSLAIMKAIEDYHKDKTIKNFKQNVCDKQKYIEEVINKIETLKIELKEAMNKLKDIDKELINIITL